MTHNQTIQIQVVSGGYSTEGNYWQSAKCETAKLLIATENGAEHILILLILLIFCAMRWQIAPCDIDA